MNLVKESIYENKNNMEKSAGLVLIYKNKILLVHPTGSSWKKTYSIPKGHVEKNEEDYEAAIRETFEEIGVKITKSQFSDEKEIIEYTDKNGKIYKKVMCFIVYLKDKPELNKKNYQLDEVDYAKFFTKEEAKDIIFWRFTTLLKYLK